MRKLVVLAVLVGFLIAGDAWLRSTAEKRLETQLASSFEGDADVELGGFPFAVRVLVGTIPRARISSDAVVRDGLRLSDVRMTLQDVEFSLSDVLTGEDGQVTVGDGRGQAAIAVTALRKRFARAGLTARLDLQGDELHARVGVVTSAARLSLRSNHLVLTIEGVQETFTVPLPRVAAGVSYDAVRLTDSGAVVQFSLTDARLRGL